MSGSDNTAQLVSGFGGVPRTTGMREAKPVAPAAPGPASPAANGSDQKERSGGATAMPPSKEELLDKVDQLNDLAQIVRREIRFSIDDSTGRTVIRVHDATTDEVVRQIPSEEVLALAERLAQGESNLLMDTKA